MKSILLNHNLLQQGFIVVGFYCNALEDEISFAPDQGIYKDTVICHPDVFIKLKYSRILLYIV